MGSGWVRAGGGGWMLGRGLSHASSRSSLFYPVRPASVFLEPACAVGAGLVEQPPPDIFPDGMRPIKPGRIGLLNFDDAETAPALDAQHMARDFREPKLLDRQPWFSGGAGIGQDRGPPFIGRRIARRLIRYLGRRLTLRLAR